MGALVILSNPFDVKDREVYRLSRASTVRRLVQRHKGLRRHTSLRRPGGVYGARRVREFAKPMVCLVNGEALPRAGWDRRIAPGDVVTFWSPPAGGGGSTMQEFLGIVLAIAVMVAAPYLGGLIAPWIASTLAVGEATSLAIGTAVVGLTLGAVSYGVMSLFAQPPPQAGIQGTGGAVTPSPTHSLGAQGNRARLEEPIPELVGRYRIFPDFITQPYSRFVDNEQFIHMGLAVSMGEVEIETDEVKIGDTPISIFEEIVWEQIQPGGAFDIDIFDPRWLTSPDVAQIELLGSADGSPWKGPFICNPPSTIVDRCEIDILAPIGIWNFNAIASDGIDGVTFDLEIEAQEIDDDGDAIGSWVALGDFEDSGESRQPLRWTLPFTFASPGRWQVRIRRMDLVATIDAGHQLDWVGLRGRLTTNRTFAGVTCIGVRMQATGDLAGNNSRKFNLVCTRKLPTWDFALGAMDETLVATRNPCDVFAHIARTTNGGRLPDSAIDLAGLYEAYFDFVAAAWTFDYVFDQGITVSEALARIARAVVAERVVQGGTLRLVRDISSPAPVAMFSPRNTRRGSVSLQYKMVDETTSDSLIGTMIDIRSWKPVDVTVAFEDSPQEKPARITLVGITNRQQMLACLWNLARVNRYRRRTVTFSTEMEGLGVLFGDPIAFTHDVPRWGQTAEVLDWDEGTRIATLSDVLVYVPGEAHYAAIRGTAGELTGPYTAKPISGMTRDHVLIGPGTLPEMIIGGDRERTFLTFGVGEEYTRNLKVIRVSPKSEEDAEIVAIDDDVRVYEAIPEDTDPPIGSPQTDIEILIDAETANVDLRTLANDNGYTGLLTQAVTVTIDTGIEVYSSIVGRAAVRRGTWPTGYTGLTLVNLGTITGRGGNGGTGDLLGAGSIGGTALDATTGPIIVDNTGATIRGGGGGGGGGALVSEVTSENPGPSVGEFHDVGGGGGGGGQGRDGGAAGASSAAVEWPGDAGAAGSSGAAGTGGAGAHAVGTYLPDDTPFDVTGPAGGAGGAFGTAGTAGTGATSSGGTTLAGGTAGAAGRAVTGNANITWIDEGTLVGPVA